MSANKPKPKADKATLKNSSRKPNANVALNDVTSVAPAKPSRKGAAPAKRSVSASSAPDKISASVTPLTEAPASKLKSVAKVLALQTVQTQPALEAPAVLAVVKPEKKLSTRRTKALDSTVKIYQIYFEAWQRELLDPAFLPLDNSRGQSELLEFEVFEQLQRHAANKDATLWGALSWRFSEKTGMQGADWVKQIADHPGKDVYFCNPHPYNEGLFHNMWLQGETSHPQFLKVVKAFLAAAGLDSKDVESIHPSASISAANYFVATPQFWSAYIAFVRKVLVAADKGMPPALRDLMHSPMADDRNLHAGASYLPFIVERLFPLFMRTEGKDFQAHKIALPERERELNVHLKLLREMKDVAHKTQSAWLAACWVNYRNLYLSQTKGKAWCEKHLRAITPTEVRFG